MIKLISESCKEIETIGEPFKIMEELWFWFIAANKAKNEGAQFVADVGKSIRACESADIIGIMDCLCPVCERKKLVRKKEIKFFSNQSNQLNGSSYVELQPAF